MWGMKDSRPLEHPPTLTRSLVRSLKIFPGARPIAMGTPSSYHRLCNALYNPMWVKSRTWGPAQIPHHPEEKPLTNTDFTMGH